MNIYKLSTIGDFHTNHNEDAYLIYKLNEKQILIAVMDGCSSGKESHFAAMLFVKILNKIALSKTYQFFIKPQIEEEKSLLKSILKDLFIDLNIFKNQILLQTEELLTTLILGIYNKEERTIEAIVIGDGLIAVNGQYHIFEQNDRPDYLAYHLKEDFENWYKKQKQFFSASNIEDLSIASDGIFTFKRFDLASYPNISEIAIVDYLLSDSKENPFKNLLKKKVLALEDHYGLRPSDDLSIIRIIHPKI